MTALARGLGGLLGMKGGGGGTDAAEIERQRQRQEVAVAKQSELQAAGEASTEDTLNITRRIPRGRRLVESLG